MAKCNIFLTAFSAITAGSLVMYGRTLRNDFECDKLDSQLHSIRKSLERQQYTLNTLNKVFKDSHINASYNAQIMACEIEQQKIKLWKQQDWFDRALAPVPFPDYTSIDNAGERDKTNAMLLMGAD